MNQSESSIEAPKDKTLKSKLTGTGLSLLTGILWMGISIAFKKMKIDSSDVMFMRSIFQIGIFLLIVKLKRYSVWVWSVDENQNIHKIRILQILQGIVSGVLLVSYLVAMLLMDIGDAMAIYFSSFLSTMILSKIFLKEKVGIYKILCGVMILAGIILVLKPSSIINDENEKVKFNASNHTKPSRPENYEMTDSNSAFYQRYYIGEISAITSMLCLSVLSVITIFLYENSTTNSTEKSVLYSGFGILFVSLIIPFLGGNQRILFAAKDTKPYNTLEWITLLAIALVSVVMVFTRFLALKFVGATIENFIFTSEIVFGYVAQVIFFGAIPDISSIIGSLCIMIACFIVPLEEVVIVRLPIRWQPFF